MDRVARIVSDVFLFYLLFILLCSLSNSIAAYPASLLCPGTVGSAGHRTAYPKKKKGKDLWWLHRSLTKEEIGANVGMYNE